ncbi:hypothetical protein AKJ40_01180 [candidate division MSBL1 archaeon SCGC-AAA259M10]|uniref:NADH:quinone oxidoreductase/Mrp antiporter membrane subunit domain-containing protein n=2 Tax=candidate division MSBL1 TaxID=215777 RepID=A0A133U6J8_9EURY|nr:hypothetical protein AKJ61_02020 [candidate division MSBL1 archaeon SCGC-AAA259B11]KXB00516.1 hypothetical protein AKJ40_01180 [candidate division MSBL1 archaeon SCGC-AAA259M10]
MISAAPILSIVVLLAGAFIIPIISLIQKKTDRTGACGYFALGFMILTLLLVLSMAPKVWNGEIIIYKLAGRSPPLGINLTIDGLAIQMALMIGILGSAVIAYSIPFMKDKDELGKFYTLILTSIAGMMGIVLTGDIFNFYVFLEIMSISSYGLIAIHRDSDGLVAGLKYLFIGTAESSFILLGITLLYGTIGSLNIADIGAKIKAIQSAAQAMPDILLLALALFVTGILIKTAMVPFHGWLVDAIASAPTPVSALLAGPEAVVGIYLIVRIPYLPFRTSIGSILIGFGAVSMVVGVLMALLSSKFKKMLAYHVISQKGYMVMAIGIGTALGLKGGLFHLLNHSTYKSLLLMSAGVVVMRLNTQNFDDYGGLLKKMPYVALTFLVGALAISGVPPLNGFLSKFTIYLAGIDADLPILTFLALLASALTLASFFKAFKKTFLGQESESHKDVKGVPLGMLIPMLILAAICIIVGLLPSLGFNIVEPAQRSVVHAEKYINAALK